MTNPQVFIELKKQWTILKTAKGNGSTKQELKSVIDKIIKLQKDNDLDSFDFENKFDSIKPVENSKPSERATTTASEPKIDENVYTEASAEEVITAKEFESWKPYFRKALAIKKLSIPFIIDEDPSLKGNPAGIGQIVNMGFHLKLEDIKKVKEL